jgi:hypothetical protein
MRIGQNPARMGLASYHPEKIGVAILVYIPIQEGYFEQSLKVLELQIDSLYQNTTLPFNLCVFDNGSGLEIKKALQDWMNAGKIDWLVSSSHNMGKTGALNWVFGAMPNEQIVYTDSDVFFRPGWLEASLRILEAFPRAGMIGAQPCFFDVLKGGEASQSAIAADVARFEYWPPRALIAEYSASLGYGEELIERYSTSPLPGLRAPSAAGSPTEAVLGASHMQFLIPRDLARRIVPLPSTQALLPQETQAIDRRIDEAGYLHLSTLQSHVLHMGNIYQPALRAELGSGGTISPPSVQKRKSRLASLINIPLLRPFLRKVYKVLFEVFS